MEGKIKNQIAFYAENDERLLDELIIDIVEKKYEYKGNLDSLDLWSSQNPHVKEFVLDKRAFDAVCGLVEENFSGSFYFEEKSYEDRARCKKMWEAQRNARTLVPSKKVWRAIKWELDKDELDDLLSYDKYRYEVSNYYNFDLMLEKIHAFMTGEKSVSYFKSWCLLLMRCFGEAMSGKCQKRNEIYGEIADLLDGVAFMSLNISEEEKGLECRELIAILKYQNHRIADSKNGRDTPFLKNGVATNITFSFSLNDGKDCMYRVCVADYKRKAVNYLYVPNLDYSEDIDYTFLPEGEFEELSSKYFGYEFDATLGTDSQLKKKR